MQRAAGRRTKKVEVLRVSYVALPPVAAELFSLDALAREIRTSVVGADDLCAGSSGSRVRSD